MIIYTGGKTGGHIMPLVNLIISSKENSLYVGYKGYLEESICGKRNIPFLGLPKMEGKYKGILKAYRFLLRELKNKKIKCVISSGGYVSIPMSLYAIFHHIPLYLLEENVILGSFNKLFSLFSKKVFSAYPIKNNKKYIHTGLPINLAGFKNELKTEFDILVIGGSLGSIPLCDCASVLSNNYKVLLIAGRYKGNYTNNNNLTVIEYSDDIYSLISKSKIIISRAGAMSTYEVMTLRKPLIVIPSEKTKGNHQVLNAKYLDDLGACKMVREKDIDKINNVINTLLFDYNEKVNMIINQNRVVKSDAIKRIWENINGI